MKINENKSIILNLFKKTLQKGIKLRVDLAKTNGSAIMCKNTSVANKAKIGILSVANATNTNNMGVLGRISLSLSLSLSLVCGLKNSQFVACPQFV